MFKYKSILFLQLSYEEYTQMDYAVGRGKYENKKPLTRAGNADCI
jgi:hypothetical protein